MSDSRLVDAPCAQDPKPSRDFTRAQSNAGGEDGERQQPAARRDGSEIMPTRFPNPTGPNGANGSVPRTIVMIAVAGSVENRKNRSEQ